MNYQVNYWMLKVNKIIINLIIVLDLLRQEVFGLKNNTENLRESLSLM